MQATFTPNFKLNTVKTFVLSTIFVISTFSSLAMAQGKEFDVTVNGQKVPREQMELIFKENQGQQADPVKLRQLVRDSVIRREVLAQQAIKDGLDKDPQVKLQIEMITRNALAAAYMDRQLKNGVTDADAKEEYDRVAKELVGKKEYQTKHILVKEEAQANEIVKKLKANPKSFEAVAKKESIDTGSAPRGGDLGWVVAGTMVPEFEQAMIAAKVGEITSPVKSQFGFHVIKVEQIRPIQAPKFEEVKDRFKDQLGRVKAEKIISDLLGKASIQ